MLIVHAGFVSQITVVISILAFALAVLALYLQVSRKIR
jgi:hypothetical protein